jgi:excisionase family DNA binding protein
VTASAPRDDPTIPPLVSATEAADLLGCSKTWVTDLMDAGDLYGVEVGGNVVLARDQVEVLAEQRRRGVASWRAPGPRPDIPPLVGTGGAAELLGFAQDNWPRELYMRGVLPGRQVGRNVVFRRRLIERYAVVRESGYAGDDIAEQLLADDEGGRP